MANHFGRYEALSSCWFELHDLPIGSTLDQDRVTDDNDTAPPHSMPTPTIHPLHERAAHTACPLPHILPRALHSLPLHRTRPPTVPRAQCADRQGDQDGTRRADGGKPS